MYYTSSMSFAPKQSELSPEKLRHKGDMDSNMQSERISSERRQLATTPLKKTDKENIQNVTPQRKIANNTTPYSKNKPKTPLASHENNSSYKPSINMVGSIASLEQLMGNKSPKQFAQDFMHSITQERRNEGKTNMTGQKVKNQNNEKGSESGLKPNQSSKNLSMNGSSSSLKESCLTQEVPVSPYSVMAHDIRKALEAKLNDKNIGRTLPFNDKGSLGNLFDQPKIQPKMNVVSKEVQEDIIKRLYEEDIQRQKKILEDCERRKYEKEMMACTFSPKTRFVNDAEKKSQLANTDYFFREQMKKAEDSQKKKDEVRDKFEKENTKELTYHPEISKKSEEIIQKRLGQSGSPKLFDRLYEIRRNPLMKDLSERMRSEETTPYESKYPESSKELLQCTFSPKISQYPKLPERECHISDFLYEDAMRRKLRSESINTNDMQRSTELSHKNSTMGSKTASSKKSQDYVINRFWREFTQALENSGKYSERLALYETVDVLRLMEFLTDESNGKDVKDVKDSGKKLKERKTNADLIEKLWEELEGKKFNYILTRNLFIFLAAICGLHANECKVQKVEERPDAYEGGETVYIKKIGSLSPKVKSSLDVRHKTKYGQFDIVGNLFLNEENVEKIKQDFATMYYNRMVKKDGNRTSLAQDSLGKPTINPFSVEIAKNQREKLLKQMNAKDETPQDIQIKIFNMKSEQTEKKREIIKKSLEKEEMFECTFTPQINDPSGLKSPKQDNRIAKLAQPVMRKKAKEAHEIEYEKNCDQCTFSPTINKKLKDGIFSLPMQKDGETIFSKHRIDKSIERMRKAKVEKDVKNQLKEKGLPFNEKTAKKLEKNLQKEQEQKKQPTIKLNDQNQQNDMNIITKNSEGHRYFFTDTVKTLTKHSEFKTAEDFTVSLERSKEEILSQDYLISSARDEKYPILIVDVNLDNNKKEKIYVFEGEKSDDIARNFSNLHGLDEETTYKLKQLLDFQLRNLLTKIDEEACSEERMSIDFRAEE